MTLESLCEGTGAVISSRLDESGTHFRHKSAENAQLGMYVCPRPSIHTHPVNYSHYQHRIRITSYVHTDSHHVLEIQKQANHTEVDNRYEEVP